MLASPSVSRSRQQAAPPATVPRLQAHCPARRRPLAGGSSLPLLLIALIAASCADSGGSGDSADAAALWEQIHEQDYRAFDRAPGYATTQASATGIHGDFVDIYVNETIANALAAGTALTRWPLDSLIVKDGFRPKGSLQYVAVMERRADSWFWAKFNPEGKELASGSPSSCTGCHGGADHDYVWSFALP